MEIKRSTTKQYNRNFKKADFKKKILIYVCRRNFLHSKNNLQTGVYVCFWAKMGKLLFFKKLVLKYLDTKMGKIFAFKKVIFINAPPFPRNIIELTYFISLPANVIAYLMFRSPPTKCFLPIPT